MPTPDELKWPADEERREINVVFDGPPGPESGRFIEVENQAGESIRFGEWVDTGDGNWSLRFYLPSRPALRISMGEIQEMVNQIDDAIVGCGFDYDKAARIASDTFRAHGVEVGGEEGK